MKTLRTHAPTALAAAIAIAAATLTWPQAGAANPPKAELHVEVATHTMPGMGGIGALGRITGNLTGGNASYGQARHPGMPGRYLDIALDNDARPGAPAEQAVPKGLRLGRSIELLPPQRRESAGTGITDGNGIPGVDTDSSHEIRYYWGCSETVGNGQPRRVSTTVRNGKASTSGNAPAPRAVPQLGVTTDPAYALWPNPSSRKAVSSRASLVGAHRVTGSGLPQAIEFEIDRAQDFMPELDLRSSGAAAEGIRLDWDGVDGARAYFIHAMGMDGDTVVMWSSSGDGYAGPELMAYLPDGTVSQGLGKRTLLSPDARNCSIPKGIFAGEPMVQMIAYGGTHTIEGDDWRVHLRNKSTTMLMGGGMGGVPTPDAGDVGRQGAKGLLRGLLGR